MILPIDGVPDDVREGGRGVKRGRKGDRKLLDARLQW